MDGLRTLEVQHDGQHALCQAFLEFGNGAHHTHLSFGLLFYAL